MALVSQHTTGFAVLGEMKNSNFLENEALWRQKDDCLDDHACTDT